MGDYVHRLNKSHGVSCQRFRASFSEVITEGKYDSSNSNDRSAIAESPVRNKNRNSNRKTFSGALVASGTNPQLRMGSWSGWKTTGVETQSRVISPTYRLYVRFICDYVFLTRDSMITRVHMSSIVKYGNEKDMPMITASIHCYHAFNVQDGKARVSTW